MIVTKSSTIKTVQAYICDLSLKNTVLSLLSKENVYIEKMSTKPLNALVRKKESSKSRQTQKGKQSYQSRLYSRPEKIESLSTDDIYVFDCTQQQIFNYFFSFGADAEVISPESLRNRFLNTYENALKSYSPIHTP